MTKTPEAASLKSKVDPLTGNFLARWMTVSNGSVPAKLGNGIIIKDSTKYFPYMMANEWKMSL